MEFNSLLLFKWPFIIISICLGLCTYIIYIMLHLYIKNIKNYENIKNSWYQRRLKSLTQRLLTKLITLCEKKYMAIYFARAFILYLWLFAIGQNKILLRRFKIINWLNTIFYILSLIYRVAILFYPALLTPGLLFFCIFFFGFNNIFRIFLKGGVIASYLIKTILKEPKTLKPKMHLVAEKIEKENKYFFLLKKLKLKKSLGQKYLFTKERNPLLNDDFDTYLDEKTSPIYKKHQRFCFFVLLFLLLIVIIMLLKIFIARVVYLIILMLIMG